MMPPAQRAAYEAQAVACLEAGATHRKLLLAVASKLGGNLHDAQDLYQQTLLSCHDAIQRRGYQGDDYVGYLLTSIRNLHLRQVQLKPPELLTDYSEAMGYAFHLRAPRPTPTGDPLAELAEQVEADIQARFSPADRVIFRLHLLGSGCQDIAELIGKRDHPWIWRRLERMKQQLRHAFRRQWEALSE